MTVKITVSLPEELVEQARRAVAGGRASSLSAYVAQALAQHGRRDTLAGVLGRLTEELGAPPSDVAAWAAASLDALER